MSSSDILGIAWTDDLRSWASQKTDILFEAFLAGTLECMKAHSPSNTIGVIGAGYVGLITAVAFANRGHHVICVEINAERLRALQQGRSPIHEPGVQALLKKNIRAGRLSFFGDYHAAFGTHKPAFIFLCVGTPPRRDGSADCRYIEAAARAIAKELTKSTIVVTKSTVPVGTGRRLAAIMRTDAAVPIAIASNPEFLREGHALEDFLHPEKIVVGCDDAQAIRRIQNLYRGFSAPVFATTLETAELAKYANNAYLATSISFANEIADLAERCNADVRVITDALRSDRRIGRFAYLGPGLGYGGPCLPKDVNALIHFGKASGVAHMPLFEGVERVNRARLVSFMAKAEFLLGPLKGKRIAMLGIAFNAGTDDARNSPALHFAEALFKKGAVLTVCDPLALNEAKRHFGTRVRYAKNPYHALQGADLLVLATHWSEFGRLDFRRIKRLMRQPKVLDTRNALPSAALQKFGFNYLGVGIPFLQGMHPSVVRELVKDAKKLGRLSLHELGELRRMFAGMDGEPMPAPLSIPEA